MMIVTGATEEQVKKALEAINNDIYDGNIAFKRFDVLSPTRIRFTLTVKNSKGKGARIGFSGRAVAAACWHVHGYFFESLFDFAPNAIVRAAGQTITAGSGNWVDRNIGSIIQPMMYSEACHCGEEGIE